MAKDSNGLATKLKVISTIVGLLAIFATLVTGFGNIGDNTEAIEKNELVDAKAHEDIEELEKAMIGMAKDVEQTQKNVGSIEKSMTAQEQLMTDIVRALPK